VVTTIEANRYLAARIGGEAVRVVNLVPEDADPLLWEPDGDAVASMQEADLVLLNGAGLERWRDRVALAPSRTVELADAYRDQWLTFPDAIQHQHGPEGMHTHTGVDPHVWMDPELAIIHARRIAEELARRFPDGAAEFRARAEETVADLTDLERRWREVPLAEADPPLLTNHPAYDYLARRCGWPVRNFGLDPERVAEDDVAPLAALAKEGARFLLWESAPTDAVKVRFESIGLHSVVISPCEHRPPEGDWLEVQRGNAARLRDAVRGSASSG